MIRDKIEELAARTFAEILETEKAVTKAAAARRPRDPNLTLEAQARAAQAEVAYQQAVQARISMRRKLPDAAMREMQTLRDRYAKELEAEFAIDPAKLDSRAMELLKAGVMRPAEYAAMLAKARAEGNHTMCRMVAKYAQEAAAVAKEKYGANDPQIEELRAVASAGNADPARTYLQNFDIVADTFRRCVNNPSMIGKWEMLTSEILDSL